MSTPRASNGLTLAPNAWNIYDAQAFTIGERETIHAVHTFPTSNKVTGKCGAWAMTDDPYTRPAHWSAFAPNCATCNERA